MGDGSAKQERELPCVSFEGAVDCSCKQSTVPRNGELITENHCYWINMNANSQLTNKVQLADTIKSGLTI